MTDTRAAIVTGAGSGIGRATAHRLARDGLPVAVLDLNAEAAETVTEEIVQAGHQALALGAVDASDREQIAAAVQNVRDAIGLPLVLINNAGITATQSFMKITPDMWERMISVNLTGPYHFCQAVIPDMIAAGWGRIVNISSSSAQSGQAYMSHYVASKAGLIGLTKALALELGPKGITVNTVPPGFVDTPMLRDSEARGYLAGTVDDHAQTTPVRRPGRPEDIANACSFLVSEDASYVTGQIIGVNGGRNT